MAVVNFPPNLPGLVRDKFKAAKAAGELTFWPTEVAVLHVNGIPFQLRFSPGISKKPKSSKPAEGKKPVDPFCQPPEALLIAEIGSPPSHILVLNKFAIVPEHFILATKDFKEQTHLLEEDDLGSAMACLQAWKMQGKELFSFFNSGEHSGASQPHRHLQFLPVDSMMEGITEGEWRPLVDRLASTPRLDLPFAYFATTIPPSPSPGHLRSLYISLHEQACRAVASYLPHHPGEQFAVQTSQDGSSAISYNLGLTDRSMVLIPRRAEGSVISFQGPETGTTDVIALNGTVLAGTLLVKNNLEWNTLKGDDSKLLKILEMIGIPSSNSADGKL